MKANELAVGDWAFSPEMKQPITIKAILEHNQVIFVQRIADNISNRFLRNCSEIEPIPITPEILEKNGFKIIQTERVGPAFGPCAELRNERFYVKVFFNGNGTISIEIGNQVSLKNENGLADMRSFTCDWVNDMCIHQLQHALRLCGIDKEIVI